MVAIHDAECRDFLQWALPQLERNWPGYRKVRRLVCKRLARRLECLALADLHAYREYLRAHAEEWQRFDALCGIPISRFYRDRGVFETLEQRVISVLAKAAASRGAIHAWSAGCASGEEPYTLAMIWTTRLHPRFPDLELQIVATDIDETLLARARAGRYSPSSLKELPEALRAEGFERANSESRVCDRFRRVQFLRQDLREGMPEGPFDLVLCRNVMLTYFAPPLQQTLLQRVADRLRPGGALVIGIHESLPHGVRALDPWPGVHAIYRKTPMTKCVAGGS